MKQSLPLESERQQKSRSHPIVSNTSPVSQTFVDNRASTAKQRKLMAEIENSPQSTAQRQLSDQIHNSPRMLAQRQQMAAISGGAVQRVEGEEELLQGKFKPIQRVEEEELLQGKFNVAQRVEEEELMQGKFVSIQRVEEEELLQGKFDTAQRVEEEELMQGKFDTVQRVEEEELLQGEFATVQRVEEEELMQGKFDTAQFEQAPAEKTNNTGLPDNLKQGIENLSGMSMDNVNVHYNSSKPAQLNALAYAQGTDIHLGTGQEKHLPHEAWHVVQQAQGRVRPTMQMKDGVPVNDDQALEDEADVMGARAVAGIVQARQEMGSSIEYGPVGLLNENQQTNPATALTMEGAGSRTDTVQKYSIQEQYMVSENKQFAVSNHGTKQSQMLVAAESVGDVATLEHIEFEQGAQVVIDNKNYVDLQPKYKTVKEKTQMEKMYCGKFSKHVTKKNEDEPEVKSLFMKVEGPASAWENHYAPVILKDGGDSGTFETAVGLDYIFFGIYGKAMEQSFKFKTEMAGMSLGLQQNVVLSGLEFQHKERLKKGEDVTSLTREIKSIKEEVALAQILLDAFQQGDSEWGQTEREQAIAIMKKIAKSHQQRLAMEAMMREQDKSDREQREWNANLIKIGVLTGIIIVGLGTLSLIFKKK